MSFSTICFSSPTCKCGIHGDSGKKRYGTTNLAWSNDFFWDGRSLSLEEQILLQYQIVKKWMKLGKIF